MEKQKDTGVNQAFTSLQEVENIKILSTEEIKNLSDKERKKYIDDAKITTDEEDRLKYIRNKKKLFWSAFAVAILFLLIISLITLSVFSLVKNGIK